MHRELRGVRFSFVHVPRSGGVGDLLVSETPVTRAQWSALRACDPRIPPDPSTRGRSDTPVTDVTWHEARTFGVRLSALLGPPFVDLRLPTDAEWEHLCADAPVAPRGEGPSPVCEQPPNRWGLYAMAGNVWHWCADLWTARAPEPAAVVRGGGWDHAASGNDRNFGLVDRRNAARGFRLVATSAQIGRLAWTEEVRRRIAELFEVLADHGRERLRLVHLLSRGDLPAGFPRAVVFLDRRHPDLYVAAVEECVRAGIPAEACLSLVARWMPDEVDVVRRQLA